MSPVKKEYIIVSVVCNEYKISVDDLTKPNPGGHGHPNKFSEPKMVAMHLIRLHTFFTVAKIAPSLGYSKTFSVSVAANWVEAKAFNDETFKRRMAKIEAILPEIFKIHK
jgi:chromosomal replication initiation ATPase DnaA